ncbi:MAG TPA: cupin-like domain-containing protein [Candidatus Elarobacter sp.]|nr:cupin-like domain-containing protein [Candidatus Elarobacter sp.]
MIGGEPAALSSALRAQILALVLRGASRDDTVATIFGKHDLTTGEKNAVVDEYERLVTTIASRERYRAMADAKAAWMMANYRRLDAQSGRPGIDELDRLDPEEFFQQYYFRNRPVKIRRLLERWQGFDAWHLPRLVSAYGDVPLEITVNRPPVAGHDVGPEADLRTVPLREFAAMLERAKSDEVYLIARNRAIQQTLSPLLDTLDPLDGVLTPFSRAHTNLWIGPRDATTYLHHDVTNVLFVQVEGAKKFWLIPPYHGNHVYNKTGVFSDVDAEHPDLARFPLFAFAAVSTTVLEEGDALLIPIGWWHQVRSLSTSVSATFLNFVHDNVFSIAEFSRLG